MNQPSELENLNRFGDLVLADRELHDALRAVPAGESFLALMVRLGAEHGCSFTAATVQAAVNEKRRAWLERWI